MPTDNLTKKEQIESLRAQAAFLETELEAERKALRASVKPEWKFTFYRDDSQATRSYMQIRPNSGVEAYVLYGSALNLAELRAAGYDITRVDGRMSYLVNFATPTPKIIMEYGGGRIFIKRHYQDVVFAQIEPLLVGRPEQVDVTAFITDQPDFTG